MKTKKIEFPINELLAKRWSPRAFANKDILQEDLNSIVEAARWAPSSHNLQPWRFLYAYKHETEEFSKIFESLTEANKVWVKDANVLMIAFAINAKENIKATFDLGTAIAYMNLQAIEKDIYMHHLGGFEPSIIRKNFEFDSMLTPFMLLAFGYLGSADNLSGEIKQKELAEQSRISFEEMIIK
jgi:nitroreductase